MGGFWCFFVMVGCSFEGLLEGMVSGIFGFVEFADTCRFLLRPLEMPGVEKVSDITGFVCL